MVDNSLLHGKTYLLKRKTQPYLIGSRLKIDANRKKIKFHFNSFRFILKTACFNIQKNE